MENRPVFDVGKVNRAIEGVQSLFSELDLTVPEAIHAVRSLDAAYKGQFSDLYAVMERGQAKKG